MKYLKNFENTKKNNYKVGDYIIVEYSCDSRDDILMKLKGFIDNTIGVLYSIDKYENGNLSIMGSTDFSYYHELEIVFEDVFFIQCPTNWSVNTSDNVIVQSDHEEQRKINIDYEIEHGYILFKLIAEDKAPIFISSKNISYKVEKISHEWPRPYDG